MHYFRLAAQVTALILVSACGAAPAAPAIPSPLPTALPTQTLVPTVLPTPNLEAAIQTRVVQTLESITRALTPAVAKPAPTGIPKPTSSPVESESPIATLSGHGTANTAAFTLDRGGNYIVHWTATTRTSSCAHAIYVRAPDRPDLRNLMANTVVQGNGTTLDGDSHAYNVQGGRYYLEIASNCADWSVIITPEN